MFNEVAVNHVAHVRDVMLELRYGVAQPSWVESTQTALRSLRAMASQMELADLCEALDEFCPDGRRRGQRPGLDRRGRQGRAAGAATSG